MKKLLTLDVGTTAVKAALFDAELRLIAAEITEYALLTPEAGIVELDPAIYWTSAVKGIRKILAETGTEPAEVCSIACTTQGETLIPVDRNGNVLHNAVVWLDSRATAEAEALAELVDAETFYRTTGVPELNGYCPVAKLLWFKQNRPEIYAQAEKFLLLEDYLVWKLSGRFVTNPALMCTTGYYDILENRIWTELLQKAGLDAGKLPEVVPCGSAVGELTAQSAAELGLLPGTVVAAGAMDQVCGAIGAGNIREGVVSETTGTCLILGATTEQPQMCGGVSVYAHALPGKYLYIGIVQTAGVIQKWFRDEFCRDLPPETAFAEMSRMAAEAPPLSRGVMLYPQFTGTPAPVADETARGVYFGLGLDTGRDCLIRALYEGVGYALRENLDLMQIRPKRLISMGGGAKSDIWNQIKADICNAAITVPEVSETASLGAAILAGVACGVFPDVETPVERIRYRKEYRPEAANVPLYERGYQKYVRMYEAFAPLFHIGQNEKE